MSDSEMSPASEASGVDRLVMLLPTQGAYQKPKTGTIVRETKTQITVCVDGESSWFVFNKKDMLRTGICKNEFPRWKLTHAT